jgi:pyruvate formate lyase activating enzyme
VPLHFTAFHPDYKLDSLPHTPASTLARARRIAHEEGLQNVYTGNVHDREGGTTFCPRCHAALIERDWHRILRYEVTDDGRCPHCATAIAGRFEPYRGSFGNRRFAVRVARR